MDADKLRVLHSVNYHIEPSCSLCVHFQPGTEVRGFGSCDRYQYHHGKHDRDMDLSVHAAGRCEDGFEPNVRATSQLGGFLQFLTTEKQ